MSTPCGYFDSLEVVPCNLGPVVGPAFSSSPDICNEGELARLLGELPPSSPLVYVFWRDSKRITAMSTALSGAADGTVKRRVKHESGVSTSVTACQPSIIKQYNKLMGGVDKFVPSPWHWNHPSVLQ